MPKTAFLSLFIIFITPYSNALSQKEKEVIREDLYDLFETEETKRRQKKKEEEKLKTLNQQKELKAQFRNAVLQAAETEPKTLEEQQKELEAQFIEAVIQMLEKSQQTAKNDETRRSKEARENKERKTEFRKWQSVFKLNHSSYVKSLFENDPELTEWITWSQNLAFLAIRFENMDLTEFFAEKGAVNVVREGTGFSLLFFSIITQKLKFIEFFLDNEEIDLSHTSVWGDNLFHIVLLGKKGAYKGKVFNLLFQEKYFHRIAHLLNIPNHHNETTLDLALREEKTFPKETQIKILRNKGALSFEDLPEETKETLEESRTKALFTEQVEEEKRNGRRNGRQPSELFTREERGNERLQGFQQTFDECENFFIQQ